ncbi:hypothetical protein GGI07_005557 [Coemansia sp. Benny D115]|nr:hypothetical protein GGI07_005557 [Coemansia sp. Benny D115]
MLGSRNQTVLKEIDTARCVGRWAALGALATKYSKHNSGGQAFARLVACEARLEELLLGITWDPRAHWKDEGTAVDNETGRLRIYYPMHLSAAAGAALEPLEREAQDIGRLPELTCEERFQQRVVLAKICFYAGRFDQSAAALPSSKDEAAVEFALSPGYGKQLAVAAAVMRGIALEMGGQLVEAQQAYAAGVTAYEARLASQASVVVVPRAASESGEELVNWPEEALYRRAMVALSLDLRDPLAWPLLSAYLRQMDAAAPPAFRAMRRARANHLLIGHLRDTADEKALAGAHTRQMALLRAALAAPRAGESHAEVLDAVDAAAEDLIETQPAVLVELLYQSLALSFNEPRVLQHLVFALENMGDFHEAALALATYEQVAARRLEPLRKRTGAPEPSAEDVRLVRDVLRVSADGARLRLLRLGDASGCLALVHFAQALASDLAERSEFDEAVERSRASVALWKGAAHAALAQRSRAPGNRADHRQAALQLLGTAVDLAPRSAEAHFHMALELAMGSRDIAAATAAAKQAVALDSSRLDAWHLLALLSSARKDDVMALRICDMAARQSPWWQVLEDITQGRAPGAFPADIDNGALFFDLAVTRMAVEGRLHGHEAALAAHPRLFSLYGCVFGPVLAAAESEQEAGNAAQASLRHGATPSHASGRRSLARSLLSRSVFKHARVHSHGAAGPSNAAMPLPPPMPPVPPREESVPPRESSALVTPKRQRSMPQLRPSTANGGNSMGSRRRDSSAASLEPPTEAFFDTSNTGASAPSLASHGSYYSPVPTRLTQQRRLASRALCLLWLASAACFIAHGQQQDAAQNALAEALAACPDSPEALTMRGQLALAQGSHLLALNDFHAAVSLEPMNIRAAVCLARVEYLLGRRDVALGLLKNVTRAHGWSDPEAWYWLGRLERELAVENEAPDMAGVQRALEYTTYALDLEASQPIRPFSILNPSHNEERTSRA